MGNSQTVHRESYKHGFEKLGSLRLGSPERFSLARSLWKSNQMYCRRVCLARIRSRTMIEKVQLTRRGRARDGLTASSQREFTSVRTEPQLKRQTLHIWTAYINMFMIELWPYQRLAHLQQYWVFNIGTLKLNPYKKPNHLLRAYITWGVQCSVLEGGGERERERGIKANLLIGARMK